MELNRFLFRTGALIVLVLACKFVGSISKQPISGGVGPNPNNASVTSPDGMLRVTVLTTQLLRIEYSMNPSQFEDRPSIAFNNRKLPIPKFSHFVSGLNLTVKTSDVTLQYTPKPPPQNHTSSCTAPQQGFDAQCSGPCSKFRTIPQPPDNVSQQDCCTFCDKLDSCRVWVYDPQGKHCYTLTEAVGAVPRSNRILGGLHNGLDNETLRISGPDFDDWAFGDVDTGNLLGTVRALDGITGGVDLNCSDGYIVTQTRSCSWAPVSRQGRALFDDSGSDVIDPQTGWITARNSSAADLYFFGHGHDYKAALADFAAIAGQVPMIPRFILGVWWSRYWPYTAEELFDMADSYTRHNMPIDVLVSDMAWHFHNESSVDWAGYQWSPQLFPDPTLFLSGIDTRRLNTTLNLHLGPVQNVSPSYEQFAKALGLDPSHGYPIPSSYWPAPYNQSVFQLLVNNQTFASAYLNIALDNIGTNWWWLDDEPYWVARLLYEHSKQRMMKGLAFARWGGLGSHRYPIGFSGDVFTEWSSLAFQPAFTATAANVLFYWSHDIGGHRAHNDEAAQDPELYLRWLQWGCFAPVMRTHPQPQPVPILERRAWAYSLPFSDFMENVFRMRYRLVPTLYTAFKKFTETAVNPIHQPYIDWPTQPGAYKFNDTLVFCDDLFIAPITSPENNITHLAERSLYLPPGSWVDLSTGSTVAGDCVVNQNFTLWEIPVFAKAGTILAMNPPLQGNTQGLAQMEPETMAWRIYHGGAAACNGSVFEDSRGWTNASFQTATKSIWKFQTSSSKAESRRFRMELPFSYSPKRMQTCDNSTTIEILSFDGKTLETVIEFTSLLGNACVELEFEKDLTDDSLLNSKFVGQRMRAHQVKKLVDNSLLHPQQDASWLYTAVNTATRMNANKTTENIRNEVTGFDEQMNKAKQALIASGAIGEDVKAIIRAWFP